MAFVNFAVNYLNDKKCQIIIWFGPVVNYLILPAMEYVVLIDVGVKKWYQKGLSSAVAFGQ